MPDEDIEAPTVLMPTPVIKTYIAK